MPTCRTEENGRLFPLETFGNGWSLSAQADIGYRCLPQQRLPTLEQYDTVEVILRGPEDWPVDPTTLGLPDGLLAKFSAVEAHCPAIGAHVTQAELAILRRTLMAVMMTTPNAGVPRGAIVWANRTVWHGGSLEAAEDIIANGIDMSRSSGGYFGHAFYVADTCDLARSNYADFAGDDDEPGAVVQFEIIDGAAILDMRNTADQQDWDASGLNAWLGRPDFAMRARRCGIAGVYDRSVGGLAIYDPAVLRVVGLVEDMTPDSVVAAPR